MRLFVENLTNVDFSYLCPERGLVGETWLASIELVGDLDPQGMVCDFGRVKKQLREWLDDNLDHRLLVPTAQPAICAQTGEQGIHVALDAGGVQLACESPSEAVTLVDVNTVDPESVAAWCAKRLTHTFGETVQQIRLNFSAEDIRGPYYHYSHGLKKHLGNCQRIAHGHRSRLLIWRNGTLCQDTMESWCQRWRDIYIGSREDVVEERGRMLTFAYRAPQGPFHLQLPAARCYVMDCDTTVELIAQHIAESLSRESPSDGIVVRAYEGVGKGAVAQCGPE